MSQICVDLASNTAWSSLEISANVCPGLFELPACLYDASASFGAVSMQCVIIRGNTTFPDPLVRLAKLTLVTLTQLQLSNSVLLNPLGALATLDWSSFFAAQPLIANIRLDTCTAGSASGLPSTGLGSSVSIFAITNSRFTGSVPSGLFANHANTTITALSVDLSGNRFSGVLPESLFANLNLSRLTAFSLALQSNALSGAISPNMLQQTLPSQYIILTLDNNRFSGLLSDIFEKSTFVDGSLLGFTLSVNNNSFYGYLPTWLASTRFASGASQTAFYLRANKNSLSGTFPTTPWIPSPLTQFDLQLAQNDLSGSIDASFWHSTASSLQYCTIDLSENEIAGSVPPELFTSLDWSSMISVSFNLSSNQLTGDLPSSFVPAAAFNSLSYVMIDVSKNPTMHGTIPSSFLSFNIPGYTDPMYASVYVGDTGLTGPLIFPDYTARTPALILGFYAVNTLFTSIDFQGTSVAGISNLDLTDCSRLSGTLPSNLFGPTSSLETFKASGTALTGVLPNITSNASSLVTLDLSGTALEFCDAVGGPRNAWTVSSSLQSCNLTATSAFNCRPLYPSQCLFSAPLCSASTKPASGASWVCIGGIWTSIGSISTPVLNIPSGPTQTVILGNVTSPTIVIQGLGSTIVIQQGCATNLTTITLTLTQAELEQLSSSSTFTQLLISTDPECRNLSDVQVTLGVSGKSCKKAMVTTKVSSGQLSAILSINDSGCRKIWWIILVSVICGVIVLAVIIFVILVIFVPAVRVRVRPYSARREQDMNLKKKLPA